MRKLLASRFTPNGDVVSVYQGNSCVIVVINDDEKTFYFDTYNEAVDEIARWYF